MKEGTGTPIFDPFIAKDISNSDAIAERVSSQVTQNYGLMLLPNSLPQLYVGIQYLTLHQPK